MAMLLGPSFSSAEPDLPPPYRPRSHGYSHSVAAVPAEGGHQVYSHSRAASVDGHTPAIAKLTPQPSPAYWYPPDWYGWCTAPPPPPPPPPPQRLPPHLWPAPLDPRLLAKGGGVPWHGPHGMKSSSAPGVYTPAPMHMGLWMEVGHSVAPPAMTETMSSMDLSYGPPLGVGPPWSPLDAHTRPPGAQRARAVTIASNIRFRGPPRKPRRSGNTLWVGNLPSIDILTLRDFFAAGLRGAAEELESVFFMSRSSCAFVNYRSESACVQAAERFRGSNCHGNVLTCRVRRSLPVSSSSSSSSSVLDTSGPASVDTSHGPVIVSSTPVEPKPPHPKAPPPGSGDGSRRASVRGMMKPCSPPDRFFILKSLTNDDLDWSTSANVYLIFSTNKTGCFYGHARMNSPIAERPSSDPSSPVVGTFSPDTIRVIPTAATSQVPAGRIVDDGMRGTLYWEMVSTAQDETVLSGNPANGDASSNSDDSSPSTRTRSSSGSTQVPASTSTSTSTSLTSAASNHNSTLDDVNDGGCGRPFEVSWLCTNPLPFIRTRNLKNPYNANKEVKVARDGTEIEPSVGGHLLRLFAEG
ncbi:MAG: hypothetical protein M1823_001431 [Watsoniomyces obsoletus]|nr:MAG: hypothetical protein M1823_001431 [Watsoniomyces obsoletus]